MPDLARSLGAPRRPRPARTIRLSVEALEGRDLPSVSPLPAPIVLPHTTIRPFDSSGSQVYLTPDLVRHAYGFDKVTEDGSGQTIAIVDAYDDPTIARDLRTFDAQMGLPNPMFTKIALGKPPVDSAWSGEIALDVEWAHAIAPKANILLVEAASSSTTDLLAAVDVARAFPGVVAVSMSWGGGEFSTEGNYDSHFTTPAGHLGGSSGLPRARYQAGGITFVASSGDSGAGAEWPAASPNVLAVGGTTLTTDSAGKYVHESAWNKSGRGTSAFEKAPSWQSGAKRTTPDVSYNADPASGLLVYNSQPDAHGATGWFLVGGTSAGAPQWAALIALADQRRAVGNPSHGVAGKGSLGNAQAALYALPAIDFYAVPTGPQAQSGFDPVTGLGSPHADLIVTALLSATSVAPASTGSGNSVSPPGSHAHALVQGASARPPLSARAPQAREGLDASLWARLRALEARPGLSFDNRLVIGEAPG